MTLRTSWLVDGERKKGNGKGKDGDRENGGGVSGGGAVPFAAGCGGANRLSFFLSVVATVRKAAVAVRGVVFAERFVFATLVPVVLPEALRGEAALAAASFSWRDISFSIMRRKVLTGSPAVLAAAARAFFLPLVFFESPVRIMIEQKENVA